MTLKRIVKDKIWWKSIFNSGAGLGSSAPPQLLSTANHLEIPSSNPNLLSPDILNQRRGEYILTYKLVHKWNYVGFSVDVIYREQTTLNITSARYVYIIVIQYIREWWGWWMRWKWRRTRRWCPVALTIRKDCVCIMNDNVNLAIFLLILFQYFDFMLNIFLLRLLFANTFSVWDENKMHIFSQFFRPKLSASLFQFIP